MAPTPTPVPPVPGELGSLDVTSPADVDAVQRITDAIDASRGAGTPGALDDALEAAGITDLSPWLPFAWAGLTVVTVLAIAALIVIVWKERRVGGVGNEIRLRRQTNAEKKTETARAKLTREGFTFTSANDADDVPPAPVNLDEDGDR